MIRVADYVIKFVEELGVRHIFVITGGGAMHLDDALGKNKQMEYVCTHHEQALAMAVEAYSRTTGNFGVGLVTTGPGCTNAITGLCGAWMDSTPCLFISGQVAVKDTIAGTKLRQRGVQEADVISLVKPITKYAVLVTDPHTIKYHLQKAVYLAKTGRPGPVWIDVPLNVQGAVIDERKLAEFRPSEEDKPAHDSPEVLKKKVSQVVELLKTSKRPVFWIGNGVKLAKAKAELEELLKKIRMPVLTTWNGADLIEEAHELYVGRPGLFGQRAANFAVQNSDLMLTVGNRLSIPQTGFNFKAFGRAAKKVFVDIDRAELDDKPFKPDIPIAADAKDFLKELNAQLGESKITAPEWLERCKSWKEKYPIVTQEFRNQTGSVNSYIFVDALSDELKANEVIVTDMGTSFTTTFQAFKVKKGQIFFTSSGLASMGFGLPGAIGACFANDKKRTICLAGEGSFMFNLQELQTVVHNKLPIKLFLLNNNTYLSIQSMQDANFKGFYVGAGPHSGLSFPDFIKVAQAFGLKTERITNHSELKEKIRAVLETEGPVLCEVILDSKEVLQPRLRSRLNTDGSMTQSPLEDMWPFLDREELRQNMLIPLFEDRTTKDAEKTI